MRNMDMKGKRLLNYMNTVCVNKNKRFFQAQTKLKMVRGELDGYSEDVKEMVLLLLCYFNENEEAMFFCVDDTCLAEEVQMDNVSLTPTIIVCGELNFIFFSFFLLLSFLLSCPLSLPFCLSCMFFFYIFLFLLFYPLTMSNVFPLYFLFSLLSFI